MKYTNEIYARNWTQDTIYCYQRGCRCENCYMKNLLESTFCNLKQVVIELVRKYGAPENKEKCLSDKELIVIKAILAGNNSREELIKSTGLNRPYLQSILTSLYKIAETDDFIPDAEKDSLPKFIKWVRGEYYD